MLELNKIYNMDCLDGLDLLDDNSIDLILTDAPYGDNIVYGRNKKEIMNNETPLLNCQMLFKAQRVLKNNSTIYNFTNWKHYPFLVNFIQNYTIFKIRMMICCNKNNIGLGYAFRNKHELILVLEKGEPKYYYSDLANVLDFDYIKMDNDTHPHEKPLNILRKLIQHSTQEGQVCLDCFSGTGNILLACKQTNRNFIGFEIIEEYCNIARDKLNQRILLNNLKSWEVKNETIN